MPVNVNLWALMACFLACAVAPCHALDHVTARIDGQERSLVGRTVIAAADGGLLLEEPDGRLWTIKPEEIVARETDDTPFAHASSDEIAARLQAELPGFDIHKTEHYILCHNTSRAYAAWCGSLFEALYRGFDNYWSRRGFDLAKLERPLVALVFEDATAYRQFAERDLSKAIPKSMIGYYNLQTNRMAMYDLTGSAASSSPRVTTAEQVNRVLSRPEAGSTVAAVVHEATHQIAFNRGLQARYADMPLWFSEGLAMFFETPDLASPRGWSSIGAVNRNRQREFVANLPVRPSDSLRTLLGDDARFRDAKTSRAAYAEAWGLTYFLIRQRPLQYVDYLRSQSAKKPLVWDTPEERLAEFEAAFGDLAALDAELVRYISRLR